MENKAKQKQEQISKNLFKFNTNIFGGISMSSVLIKLLLIKNIAVGSKQLYLLSNFPNNTHCIWFTILSVTTTKNLCHCSFFFLRRNARPKIVYPYMDVWVYDLNACNLVVICVSNLVILKYTDFQYCREIIKSM